MEKLNRQWETQRTGRERIPVRLRIDDPPIGFSYAHFFFFFFWSDARCTKMSPVNALLNNCVFVECHPKRGAMLNVQKLNLIASVEDPRRVVSDLGSF